ncbi:biopolymer transporter ExbD [Phragmitibacter flavus]|uniref:Biopolymer transporter ExbD n=1 Tax=Phragmitibacter flavus TaxID=2576071 RepID=A0A5R8KB88_9BACT|nr:biopolymer transporter ExbD [Phragmitibacter flavus]TLD69583.1 biopolymer transporter ExbD [Phragmitibacter flavus]
MSNHRKGRRNLEVESINLGFQIAPMVDVIFVIMLYFMVMAAAVKVEHELKTNLPGVSTSSDRIEDDPDEVIIEIDEDGIVLMNDEEFDTPQDKSLPTLTNSIARLKEDADSRGSKVLVTIQTAEQAKYERIIDVMNALAAAKIANVTFTVGTEEF